MKTKNIKIKKLLDRDVIVCLLTIMVTLVSILLVSQKVDWRNLQTSLIASPLPPFDGTSMPIKKVPDWFNLNSGLWEDDYEKIPVNQLIDTPKYDAEKLKKSLQQLDLNQEKQMLFNLKSTYIIPYMGTYKLDNLEYTGSHLGIDIRAPKNTPVYAIGNGVVVKVSISEIGFGNHIVIKHENFPSLDNPEIKTTYYSSYSHLSTTLVKEKQIVLKGEKIGLTGQSGNATLPHLHFQIDNRDAPWHPYWPFSTEEANQAGYDLNGAVNAGLGKEKALLSTIHPLVYVQKYLDFNADSTDINSLNLHGSAREILPEKSSFSGIKRIKPLKVTKSSVKKNNKETFNILLEASRIFDFLR